MQPKAAQKPGLWVSEHPDGLVILDPCNGQMYIANKVGAQVWSGLSKGMSLDAIVEHIAQAFYIEPERAMRDAEAFIGDLRRDGLLDGRESQ